MADQGLWFRKAASRDPTFHQHISLVGIEYLTCILRWVRSLFPRLRLSGIRQGHNTERITRRVICKARGPTPSTRGSLPLGVPKWARLHHFPAGAGVGLEMTKKHFHINPFTWWTGCVGVILIFHVCENHFTGKKLIPHSLRSTFEFGATLPDLVSNTWPYCVNISHSCGSRSIIRRHPTEAFVHI